MKLNRICLIRGWRESESQYYFASTLQRDSWDHTLPPKGFWALLWRSKALWDITLRKTHVESVLHLVVLWCIYFFHSHINEYCCYAKCWSSMDCYSKSEQDFDTDQAQVIWGGKLLYFSYSEQLAILSFFIQLL